MSRQANLHALNREKVSADFQKFRDPIPNDTLKESIHK